MRGAAQAAPPQDPVATAAPSERGNLGLDEGGHRGEVVGDVVDQDLDLDAVDRIDREHAFPSRREESVRLPKDYGQSGARSNRVKQCRGAPAAIASGLATAVAPPAFAHTARRLPP